VLIPTNAPVEEHAKLLLSRMHRDGDYGNAASLGGEGNKNAGDVERHSEQALNQTESPEFKSWFSNSKVVDKEGKPLTVYHGTDADFNTFKLAKEGSLGKGIYLTPKPEVASSYANESANAEKRTTGQNVKPVYANLKNPLEVDRTEHINPAEGALQKLGHSKEKASAIAEKALETKGNITGEIYSKAIKAGHDGIIVRNADNTIHEIVAFKPEQVKSSTGNSGEFNPNNKDIRYSEYPEDLSNVQVGDPARKGFFGKVGSAATDKVSALDPQASEGLNRALSKRSRLHAELGDLPVRDILALKPTQQEIDKAFAYRRFKYTGEDEGVTSVTPKEEAISKIMEDGLFGKVGDRRLENGMKVRMANGELRTPGRDEWYANDSLNKEALRAFTSNPNSPESKYLRNKWIDYVVSKAGEGAREDMTMAIDERIKALNGGYSRAGSSNVEFNALRKAEGYGLPKELRETNGLTAIRRYANRAANDLAFYEELQSNPRVAAALGIRDQEGNIPKVKGVQMLSGHKDVQDAMKFVYNDFESVYSHPKTMAAARMVASSLIQTLSGVRDIAAAPVQMLPYMHKFEDVGAFFKGITNMRKEIRNSVEFGARSTMMDADRWHTMETGDKFVDFANKFSEVMRKYTGRDAMEQGVRLGTFAIGKEFAQLNAMRASAGDRKSIKWLEKFGTLVDGEKLSDPTKLEAEDYNQIAKNFVDRNQGTYDARGLSAGTMEGPLAPFLALSRWSIEKSNVIWKDVVVPAKTGENYLPLLTYTLGTFMTGAAIRELNEFMTGKKSQTASLSEAMNAGNKEHTVAALVNLMQLGGLAGVMSDIAKMGTDAVVEHQLPKSINFPLVGFLTDNVAQGLADWASAIDGGADKFETTANLVYQIMKNGVQDVRAMDSRVVNADQTDRQNKFRDLRVFKKLNDYDVPSLSNMHVNPLLNPEEKKFKQTEDVGEAARMLPELIQKAIKEADGNPEKLASKLRGLKSNSYQTMPSPDAEPKQFMDYISHLRQTQGDSVAMQRLADYLRQRDVNKIKGQMVP
jgi:hypothetical protein